MKATLRSSVGRVCRRLSTTVPPVLLLGDERLRRPSADCVFGEPSLLEAERELHAALARFRSDNGYGRAMSAPQINRHLRMIACDLGEDAVHRPSEQPFTICNPSVIASSADSFSLWDDCMSLPWVLCRVRRHKSISVSFVNEDGYKEVWEQLPTATSELLQHELDHLDGVLITDRMLECAGDGHEVMVSREAYVADPSAFDALVDVHIASCEYPVDVKILNSLGEKSSLC